MAPPILLQLRTGCLIAQFQSNQSRFYTTQFEQFFSTTQSSEARHLFEELPHRDEAVCMKAYLHARDPFSALSLFSHLRNNDPSLSVMDPFLVALALKSSASNPSLFSNGSVLHSFSVKSAFINSVFVSTAVVDMYSKSGQTQLALQLFDEMPDKNVVTWTTIITALVHSRQYLGALNLFVEMHDSNIHCDSHAYAITLKACSNSGLSKQGRELHARILKQGFGTSPFVTNTLASMYSKCGFQTYSTRVLNRMDSLDVTSWTTIISSHIKTNQIDQAIESFVKMQTDNHVNPNEYTYATIISSCIGVSNIKFGEQLHCQIIRKGFSKSQSVSNALVTMYARTGNFSHADMAFREMEEKDVISWTAIISTYSQQGLVTEAFELFLKMLKNGNNSRPNEFTLASLLSLCANFTLLKTGRELHGFAIVIGIAYDSVVVSALIDMYCKNGCIQEAESVFLHRRSEDLVVWTAMICGYADHGRGYDAVKLFDEMSLKGLKPDKIAFIGVLMACCHVGNVELGFKYFESMKMDYGFEPVKEHYGCIVNMLTTVGRVEEAKEIVERMPRRERDGFVWTNLLRGCVVRGEMERVVKRVGEFERDEAGVYVAVANLYASNGMWNEAMEERERIRERGLVKEVGFSLNSR